MWLQSLKPELLPSGRCQIPGKVQECLQGNLSILCFLNDLTHTALITCSHLPRGRQMVTGFGPREFHASVVYKFFISSFSQYVFSESSLVLNISHDCFLTVISFQIYYWMLLCMCLMLKELFVMTIMCFCWIFTVVFNNHETCTGTAFWNLKFSAKIINILNNKVKIYRPIEILNKLVSIFNLVKNSRKVSTDIFLGLFLVYEKNGNVAFKWYMQSTGSVAMSKLQQTSKTLWTFL